MSYLLQKSTMWHVARLSPSVPAPPVPHSPIMNPYFPLLISGRTLIHDQLKEDTGMLLGEGYPDG